MANDDDSLPLIRVCIDTVITSGRMLKDLDPPEEMAAVEEIERLHHAGVINRVKATASQREEERTKNPLTRAKLAAGWNDVSVLQPQHAIAGMNFQDDGLCFFASPIITEIVNRPVFDGLQNLGLKRNDALIVMAAINSDCEYFVTLDGRDILPLKTAIESAYPIRVMRPTEFVAEINLKRV